MHLDILCSLVIYTLATVAFYLLGAGVLHKSGVVPAQPGGRGAAGWDGCGRPGALVGGKGGVGTGA